VVTTQLKRGFYHLKSLDCERCVEKFWLPMEGMNNLILQLVRLVFRSYEFLVAFRYVRVGTEKVWAGGAGWDGLRGGFDVCRAGADKISQTSAGAWRV